ncbi:uncharacterized protein isoform X3 [Leptinotarsa decemlineata]|uniref:uncharacterized protein isoform X2 n=1 Tax=Leptinotarsa decemlineata TaxID=7539 RepID=UPI003D308A17
MPRDSARVVGALSGDGTGSHLVASPVRKERFKKSKKELAEEAARVLKQVDQVDCVSKESSVLPEKFYTLPNRKKQKNQEPFSGSLDRRSKRRTSSDSSAPQKPPRAFITGTTQEKPSVFEIFRREKKPEPKKSNLRRSVSDASTTKSKVKVISDRKVTRSGSDGAERVKPRKEKKQLSPIIETAQREDYFSHPEQETDKENVHDDENLRAPLRKKKKDSITEKLKQFIDEVDEELYKETGIRPKPPEEVKKPPEEVKKPQPIIIDVDKAEKISTKSKKFKNSALGKKLKAIAHKKNKTNEAIKLKEVESEINKAVSKGNSAEPQVAKSPPNSPGPIVRAAIEHLENPNNSPKMIHSSQKPVDKLPLTKGRTVDSMVKRLSTDSCSPPPHKTNVMITPHASVQHNNNQPFSYTRGVSPEKYAPDETHPNLSSPIIYAQVVCAGNANGPAKQTIHTAYTNGKKHPHSDSDEGLGGEENQTFIRIEKPVTRFGDDRMNDFFDEVDKFEEESPITPKFRNPVYTNGYSSYEKKDFRAKRTGYFDSSSRGRGDGMDSKRRESLTEPHENGFSSTTILNGRSDLTARRDQLESRINRRLNDNSLRTSPEYIKNPTPTNIYVTETSSKYYRGRSGSPVGFREKYVSETRPGKYGKPHTTESRSMQFFGEAEDRLDFETSNGYYGNGFDSEPKSFDSQISDYRSSPENRKFETSHRHQVRDERQQHSLKDRTIYKSSPDIHLRSYQESNNSLQRDKVESRTSFSKYASDRYMDENERKDKFVDSGIENDFRRDSGDNFRVTRQRPRREYCNESEDEGFASSLLIASERQHTEDNFNQRRRREYDSDRAHSREDDPYRNLESMEYRSKFRSNDYIPRERSIDDGSHYDPKIDKDIVRSTLKRVEKKPPKPEKKSGLEKMKSLFTRDSKKKKQQQAEMVNEETLRERYVEYKGREPVEPRFKKREAVDLHMSYDYNNRRRLSSPSPSPTREPQRNGKSENSHGSWFKSLDRLSRKKTKVGEKEGNFTSGTEDDLPSKPTPTKNLRFFGDTDVESNDSVRHKSAMKSRSGLTMKSRSQSTRDLHNISEELRTPEPIQRKTSHKSMTNISETERDMRGSRTNLKPPMSPSHVAPRIPSRQEKDRGRRRKNEVSSVESSTEGDSSQQSQRSIVYLHAATVGDIPRSGYLRNGRRAASREELASNGSSRMQPQVKTLSRSFSVLAPWKPRHARETMDIDYTQYPKPTKNGKYEQKPSKTTSNRKDSSSTLKKKAQESRKNQSTLKKSKSKENLGSQTLRRSREELSKSSSSTLYKKKDRLPRENSRYSRDRDEKKTASKSLSVESLGSNGKKFREEGRDISRSVSMPRDPEKSAGWFKMSKKNKLSGSTQRL